MSKQSNAEVQAAFKARMRKDGFKQIAVWVHVEDEEKLKAYITQLKKVRSK
jgi:hypothetical protein